MTGTPYLIIPVLALSLRDALPAGFPHTGPSTRWTPQTIGPSKPHTSGIGFSCSTGQACSLVQQWTGDGPGEPVHSVGETGDGELRNRLQGVRSSDQRLDWDLYDGLRMHNETKQIVAIKQIGG